MNILFTICGRAGSKGVRNKNLRDFLGKPLVYYTLAAINEYRQLYENGDSIQICLSTDSAELIELVKQYGMQVHVIPRAAPLCGDDVSKMMVIRDCLKRCEAKSADLYDVVVDLDITSPLRTANDIYNVIHKQVATGWDVVFSVAAARRNPFFNMVREKEDGTVVKVIESQYTARQQAPAIFDMNASIYAWKPSFLNGNTSGMLFDGVCGAVEMRDTAILDIDSEEDFELLEILAEYFFKKHVDYIRI